MFFILKAPKADCNMSTPRYSCSAIKKSEDETREVKEKIPVSNK